MTWDDRLEITGVSEEKYFTLFALTYGKCSFTGPLYHFRSSMLIFAFAASLSKTYVPMVTPPVFIAFFHRKDCF